MDKIPAKRRTLQHLSLRAVVKVIFHAAENGQELVLRVRNTAL